jgi:hypothetical protein
MLSNQPRLTCITPTAPLGSWILQLIKGMTFLGTDFKKHAKWQGSVEEPAAKDFVARKVCTIEWNEVQGTIWNAIKCKECLRSCPEAVIRQVKISTFIHKFGNPLWILFPSCTALTWRRLMSRKKMSFWKFCVRRKGMICNCLMDVCMRNLSQRAERGKKAGTNSCTRFPRASCFEKMHHVCQRYGGTCTMWYLEYKRYTNGKRNQIPAQPRKVQRN